MNIFTPVINKWTLKEPSCIRVLIVDKQVKLMNSYLLEVGELV